MSDFLSFRLTDSFVEQYQDKKVDWGFPVGGGLSLGEITFLSKYSRKKEDGTKERWHEVCRRCVEGTYSILRDHCAQNRTPWNAVKSQKAAEDMYDRMFNMKWLPPGRGLWAMGTKLVNDERNSAPLYNCTAISSERLSNRSVTEAVFPFVRLMEMSLYGIGCGYDTRGANKLTLSQPTDETVIHVIGDTREDWAASLGILLESYFFKNRPTVEFNYNQIRLEGTPLVRSGGLAPGPEPLINLHRSIRKLLGKREGEKLGSLDIVDIMNMAAKAVVSGGIRRSATLALGSHNDQAFLTAKDFNVNPERMGPAGWGYLSNNTVIANVGDDLSHITDNISLNGEPGIFYLDVAKKYGRLKDPENDRDVDIDNINPCVPPWAPVLTPNGLSTIGEASVGDKIWSESGWTTITKKWSNGVKPVHAYLTAGGVFYGTEDHKIVSKGIKVPVKNATSIDGLMGPDFLNENIKSYPIIKDILLSKEEVFDITVDNPTHTYWTGGLNVSNCAEIVLEGKFSETCNLQDSYPMKHETLEDFKKTLKCAYLYSKAVTMLPTPWSDTNEVVTRNRRIGASMSGIAEFVEERGWQTVRDWCSESYDYIQHLDEKYSKWLGIRESIRTTTVKPSGSTSILNQSTPGVHWPVQSGKFIRRQRFNVTSPMLKIFEKAGYNIEPDVMDPLHTRVIEFPVEGHKMRDEKEVTLWEKMSLAMLMQEFYADNSVSATFTFRPDEKDEIGPAIKAFEGKLKTLSFLPLGTDTHYQQMPYEAVTETEFNDMRAQIKPIDVNEFYGTMAEEALGDKFCTNDSCEI